MLTTPEKLVFAALIVATAAAFLVPIVRRVRIVLAGAPEDRFGDLGKRFRHAVVKVLFQRCTLRRERVFTGLMHVGIFYGALTFDTMTVSHTLEGFIDGFYLFGRSGFGLVFSFAVDAAAIAVMAGVVFLAFRRFVVRPKAYATTPGDSALIYLLITLATATYLYFEAFSIAHHPGDGPLVVPRSLARRPGHRVGDERGGRGLPLQDRLVGPRRRRLRLHRLRPPLQVPPHVRRTGQRVLPAVRARAASSRPSTSKSPRSSASRSSRTSPGRTTSTPSPAWNAAAARTPARPSPADKPLSPKMILVNHGKGPARRRQGRWSRRSATTSRRSSRDLHARARSGPARPAAPVRRSARSRSSTSARSSGPGRARS